MLLWIIQGLWLLLCVGLGLCYVKSLRPLRGTLEWIVGCSPVFPKTLFWHGTLNRQDVLWASGLAGLAMGFWAYISHLFLAGNPLWSFEQIYWFVLDQLLLPGATAFVVYFLFRNLFSSKRIGIIAGLYIATCPTDAMDATLVLSLVLLLALQYWDNHQAIWWQYTALALCGATLAVGTYLSPWFLVFLGFFPLMILGKALVIWSEGCHFWKTFLLSMATLLGSFALILFGIYIPMALAIDLPIFSQSYLFLLASNLVPILNRNTIAVNIIFLWPMHWSWFIPFVLGYVVLFGAMIRHCSARSFLLHWYVLLVLALWIFGGISAMALATMVGLGYLLITLFRRNRPIPAYLSISLLFLARIAIAWLWLI